MEKKLEMLFEKVERVADMLEASRVENTELEQENDKLKTQLAEMTRELETVKLSSADQAGRTRTKLLSVLDRLDQLEKLGA